MNTMNLIIFVVLYISFVEASFFNPYPRFKSYRDGGNPGEPLFLTPYIDNKQFDKARTLAKVTGDLGQMESYSGYITVNKDYNSNMFFWYFPPQSHTNTNAVPDNPVILWLQGGPGASSLFGLFTENGPFLIKPDGTLGKREYSWNNEYHLIYIDNPVGTGFSFTDHDAGYSTNEVQVSKNLYEAISQIFQLFPQLQLENFYIFGESYGGKYVPAAAYRIHVEQERNKRRNITPKADIKLAGVGIGNGLSDPLHQLNYADYLYQIGLIDDRGQNEFRKLQRNGITCIKQRNMTCAFEVFDMMLNMDQYKWGSLFQNLTGYDTYYNYLKPFKDNQDEAMGKFLQSSSTRSSIHVGNKTFHDLEGENKVEDFLKNDIMDTVAPWVAQLLDRYRVLIYNGQLDIIVAYPLTVNYLHLLKFQGKDIYINSRRNVWKVDDDIAGYVRKGGNLVEVLVRNAGHMAPSDQPKWVLNMVNGFVRDHDPFD